jgi:hypothetical protein
MWIPPPPRNAKIGNKWRQADNLVRPLESSIFRYDVRVSKLLYHTSPPGDDPSIVTRCVEPTVKPVVGLVGLKLKVSRSLICILVINDNLCGLTITLRL